MARWLLLILSWLLTVVQRVSAVVLPIRDVTITVPDGVRYFADKHLICVPTSWSDVASFFLGNYLSHAATVVPFPGESKYVLIANMALAIIFPAMGASRGLLAIIRHAATISDPVQQALRSRALCMVVRSENWKPKRGEIIHSLTYIREDLREDEDGCNGYRILAKHAESAAEYAKHLKRPPGVVDMKVETPPWVASAVNDDHLEVVPRRFQIFGTYHLPQGYELAYVPSTAIVQPMSDNKSDPEYRLFSTYSVGSAVIAIIQIIYASVTLYHSRGDQVSRYGYSSFSFTVVPYLIMSFVNMLGNLVNPSYSSIYMVHSEMMDEAIGRGGQFEGMVGKLESSPIRSPEFAVFSGSFEEDSESHDGWKIQLEDSKDQSAAENEEAIIVSPKEAEPQKENADDKDAKSLKGITERGTPKLKRGFSLFKSKEKESEEPTERGLIICPSCYSFKEMDKRPIISGNHPDQYSLLGWAIFRLTLLAISALPLAVIGGMSGFKRGTSSTVAQRAWTMTWLAVGSIGGNSNASHALAKELQLAKDARGRKGYYSRVGEFIFFLAFVIALGTPAIGGFMTVAQMLRDYGSCSILG